MSPKQRRDQIRQEQICGQSKQAFLVEGSDDKEAFRILFKRFLPGWERRWAIAEAGNKRQLLDILSLEPDWLGLVDRDEWDQAAIDRHSAARPNLMVLPRFCLENYLTNPAELWRALPEERQAQLVGGEATLAALLGGELPRYRRHGALWKVVTPLWSGLRARGFKEVLASEESLATAQDDTEIRRILGDWDALLDPNRIFSEFQAQLALAETASLDEQYWLWLHGKVFWSLVVNPAMNRVFNQMTAQERRKKILEKLPLPTDLQPILDRLS